MEVVEARVNDVDEEKANVEGKTIVLGVRADTRSRELVTWALINVANSCDRVVAIHVRRFPYPADDSDKYVDELELMRKAYEGFCRLRQIDLVIKICRGFSVRRTLVHQVKSYSASYLILGEAKSSNAIRFSLTSIPKYCAKRLPLECSVVAVNNGKIVFGTGVVASDKRAAGHNGEKPSFLLPHRKSIRAESLVCLLKTKGQEDSIDEDNWCSKEMVDGCLQESKTDSQISSNSSNSFSVQEPTDDVGSSSSILRRGIISHRRTISMEGSRTTFVQLAKFISGLSSTNSPNRLVGKHRRFGTFTACNLYKDENLSPFHTEESNIGTMIKSLHVKYSMSCKLFTYMELMQATCNFSLDRVIGKGGSSLVYKGILSDGKELAIKVLKPSKDSMQQFVSEIDVITTLNHKNIISLLGFCLEGNNLVLIYEFLSRGSLEEILHEESKCALNWYDRYRIAIAVAKALDYLHDDFIIHMDVKSSNILLSEDFVPKLSDFGLARRPIESVSHISSNYPAGTFGYLAPEYFMFGQISTKIDMYAFGVVLLELLSGKKPINSDGIKGDASLVIWALPLLQSGKDQELMDPRLCGKYDIDQMEWMALAASLCLQRDYQSRPTMPDVLKLLHGDNDYVKWAKSMAYSSGNATNLKDADICLIPDIKSHLNLLMLNSEDHSLSASSNELLAGFTTDGTSMEDYLQGRLSQSSSID